MNLQTDPVTAISCRYHCVSLCSPAVVLWAVRFLHQALPVKVTYNKVGIKGLISSMSVLYAELGCDYTFFIRRLSSPFFSSMGASVTSPSRLCHASFSLLLSLGHFKSRLKYVHDRTKATGSRLIVDSLLRGSGVWERCRSKHRLLPFVFRDYFSDSAVSAVATSAVW